MQLAIFTSILIPLLTLTSSTTAAPTSDHQTRANETTLSKRDMTPGGVYMCKDANWQGECRYMVFPMNQCYDLEEDWKNVISSFGPDLAANDKDKFTCTIHMLVGCQFEALTLKYPGSQDLKHFGMNDVAESVSCAWEDPGHA